MVYLQWYLGIGVAVLLVVFVSHKLSHKGEPSIADMLESVNPDRHKWHYKLLNNYVVPVVAAILLPLVWPLMVYWKAREFMPAGKPVPAPEPKEFSLSRKNLVSRTSPEEIESREKVVDPLQAVPAVPFGFLNAAWEQFKLQARPGDEMWSFVADWDEWGQTERRRGYAILRAGAVPHWFLTGWDTTEIPTEPPAPEPTLEEMERKLTARNWEVRWGAVSGNRFKLTPTQIDRAQRDGKRLVRFAIAKRFDLDLTPAQIETGLRDPDEPVREIYSYRSDYTLTDAQIERGLTDKSSMIRFNIAGRRDVAGRLTAAQLERGLIDEDEHIRARFAKRGDFSPTAAQIERGLNNSREDVRLAFAGREDLRFTPEQIERGLPARARAARNPSP